MIDNWSFASAMVKFALYPSHSISSRRTRTQKEWNVDMTISFAAFLPTSCATRSRISSAAFFVNVTARILAGDTLWSTKCATR